MIKTCVYVPFFISFKFCTQKIHALMHQHICATSLSCHLNSTREYKHLYFYHLPLNKLAHNNYMMITTQVYVLYLSDCFLVLCISKSPVVIISTQKCTRWHDASYICAFVEKFILGVERFCFLYFDFIKHTIYLNFMSYSKSQNLNLGGDTAYL